MIRFRVAIIFALIFGLSASAQFASSKNAVSVSTALAQNGAVSGKAMQAAVVLDIKNGWHINSSKPLNKYLIATSLKLEPVDGVTVDGIAYPPGQEITLSFSDTPLSVYEGKKPIGITLTIADSVAPGSITIKGTLRVQACNDKSCLGPANLPVEIAIPVLKPGETPALQEKEIFDAIATYPTTKPEIPPAPPTVPAPTSTPAPPTTAPAVPAQPVVEAPKATWKELLPKFSIAGQTGFLTTDEFIAWIDRAEKGAAAQPANGAAGTIGSIFTGGFTLKGLGLPVVILLTIVGGIALNLTPCVLPLIPINLAIIGAGAKAGSRSRGFFLGGMYGLGTALLYGVLGVVAVLGAASFGSLNAQWWFNAAITVIFVVLALAMFDVILIDFTKYQSKLGIKKDSGSFVFAFIMGAINALLAGACVAPVVIAVVLYSQDAYANGNPAGLLLPFLLGLGMALPWPFAGGGMAFLPKPGMWMVRVKQAFGVFILIFAIYYGYQAYEQFSARYLVDRNAVLASAQNLNESGWVSSLDEGLAIALKENKPVLIDFWASWCKNCLYMNETTFKDPNVLKRLDGFVKVKFQAEEPDVSPARDVLSNFQFVGLPLYVVLKPNP